MRFLRESAVERVHGRHDDAARNQQGDVRRMSLLSSLRDAPRRRAAVEIAARPRVGGERSNGAAASRWSPRMRVEPLPDGALVPSLDGRERRTTARRSSRALTRVLDTVGRPRRIGLVVPDVGRQGVAGAASSRCRRAPQDLDQLVRWQVRKSAPFAIEEAQVSYVPGLRADDGQEFIVVAGAARGRSRNTRRCAPRPARTPGSSIWRRFNVDQRRARGRRRAGGRLAAGQRRAPTTRRSPSCAGRT